MLDRFITYGFYILFFLTPLLWTSKNYELFEFNKMLFTYGITVFIAGVWILKSIQQRNFIFKKTPLDIPLILFLAANILSTIFSIDTHTSVWGYYSRLNGGLLSTISYTLLYWAFVSNFESKNIRKLFFFTFASGAIISFWGILEHFGISPSCIILRGELNANCWVQDVQARVFATLGQPNWMAGYLGMLIFPTLYYFLTAKTRIQYFTFYFLLFTYYLAFTFTYSRGPTLGLTAGFIIFLSVSIYFYIFPTKKFIEIIRNSSEFRKIFLVIISFLIINFLFGSALTDFKLISKFASPARPAISLTNSSTTQLENGGTESGEIRLIVWKGALDIFRHYPFFGTGLETFAYSYYQFRPVEHNLTSEWDFLYNKAHNEYLNYLANTGIVGFGIYLLVIGTFLLYCFRFLILRQKHIKQLTLNHLLLTSIFASYISYLVYNFFLFSVVILALFFFLFPAIGFVATDSTKSFQLPKFLVRITRFLNFIYHRPTYTKSIQILILLTICYLLFIILKIWYADTIFSQGQRANDGGNPGKAYNLLTQAVNIRGNEPLYRSELSFAAASAAVALNELGDASSSSTLKNMSSQIINQVLESHPKNISYLRTAIRIYFELSQVDNNYLEQTLATIDKAIKLAPTDPKLYYNQALILQSVQKYDESIQALQEAIKLKPNYKQAADLLNEATSSNPLKSNSIE